MDRIGRHHTRDDPQARRRHPGHMGMIRLFLPPALDMAEGGVFHVAVLHFLRTGSLLTVEHPVSARNRMPAEGEIPRRHRAVAVRNRMEQFERNAVAVNPHPEVIAVIFRFFDFFAGIVDIRFHDRGQAVGLQIKPEYPFVQGQAERGDAAEGVGKRAFQQNRIHLFPERHTHTKHRGPVPCAHSRIYFGRIIQGYPAVRRFMVFHPSSPPPSRPAAGLPAGVHRRYGAYPPRSSV